VVAAAAAAVDVLPWTEAPFLLLLVPRRVVAVPNWEAAVLASILPFRARAVRDRLLLGTDQRLLFVHQCWCCSRNKTKNPETASA